jgi:hypothetical protein
MVLYDPLLNFVSSRFYENVTDLALMKTNRSTIFCQKEKQKFVKKIHKSCSTYINV